MFACLYVPPLASPLTLRPLARGGLVGPRTSDDNVVGPRDVTLIAQGELASVAREFSPRVEVHGPGLVTLDARGLERLFGDAPRLGEELRRATADRRLHARVALASTRTAAWLIAHARAGLTVVAPGDEPRWLSPLPLQILEQLAANGLGPGKGGPGPVGHDRAQSAAALVSLLKRWGLRTLGEFAALDAVKLSERLGQQGLAWQAVARGEELAPLVPDEPEERFEETLALEWPIEGLQPLSFVFGRLFDALSARLVERDRAAAVLHIHLQLVTREVERRSLQLPAPMRDARVLRTLAILNLEAHPVAAGIDRVTVVADPVPGRVIQCSLLTRALPFPEQLSTLLARLGAVVGDDRCGMAALVDSYRPGAFEMQPFSAEWHPPSLGRNSTELRRGRRAPGTGTRHEALTTHYALRTRHYALGTKHEAPSTKHHVPGVVLRRFRLPIPVSVIVHDGRPVRVVTARRPSTCARGALGVVEGRGLGGGSVEACAGPWRTSGEWWRVADARVQVGDGATIGWNRDEWDVNLADGGIYRIYRDRDRDRWFIDGVID